MERIAQLYQRLTDCEPQDIVPLAGAGSNRRYFRVKGEDDSLIAVIGTNKEENEAFIDLAQRFRDGDLPVPAVLAVSKDRMVYLQEDCGDVSLYSFMAQHRQADGTL
ncbi:MAG: phosphotransferase, partial [Bacteroidaceae bacterium]|nr:phosphotransferase [Bacteroidaceae bacterium]